MQQKTFFDEKELQQLTIPIEDPNTNPIYQINKKENIFGDDIAFIEQWDFSKANLNEENRQSKTQNEI